MQVFPQIATFSLQIDGSGRPVLTEGKHPKIASGCRILKAPLQPTGIPCHGTIFISENSTKAEIRPIRSLR